MHTLYRCGCRVGLWVKCLCHQESCFVQSIQQQVEVNQSAIRRPALKSAVSRRVIERFCEVQPTLQILTGAYIIARKDDAVGNLHDSKERAGNICREFLSAFVSTSP